VVICKSWRKEKGKCFHYIMKICESLLHLCLEEFFLNLMSEELWFFFQGYCPLSVYQILCFLV
jgi:hypothetical protein